MKRGSASEFTQSIVHPLSKPLVLRWPCLKFSLKKQFFIYVDNIIENAQEFNRGGAGNQHEGCGSGTGFGQRSGALNQAGYGNQGGFNNFSGPGFRRWNL